MKTSFDQFGQSAVFSVAISNHRLWHSLEYFPNHRNFRLRSMRYLGKLQLELRVFRPETSASSSPADDLHQTSSDRQFDFPSLGTRIALNPGMPQWFVGGDLHHEIGLHRQRNLTCPSTR